jgi:hypothetical protein
MWSMPKSVLRVVAVIIAFCAVGGFVLGVRGAPEKARLPGESAAAGTALDAPDATILDNDERPPPPPEKTEEELAAEAEKKKADEEARAALDAAKLADAADAAPRIAPPPPTKAPTPPTDDQVGDLIDGLTPPPEQPPY